MLLLGAIAAALADDPDRERFVIFPEDPPRPLPATFEGAFDDAPAPHWSARLPGGRLNAANHTERTRPVVVGEGILVGSAAGDALYMLSRRDGSLIRSYPAANSVESGATVVGDLVYFADSGGVIWCYRLDGSFVWKHESDAPILVSPTVQDGRLYITTVDDLALALDAGSGALVWQYQRKPDPTREAELALYAAPPAVPVRNAVLFGFSDGAIVGLDAASGDVVLDRRVGEGRYPDLVAAPVVHGSDIFASGYFEPLVALDVATQNVRWRIDAGAANAPVIDESTGAPVLYHPGTDGKLRAIVALTGAEMWTLNSGTTGALTTPVVTPAGMILASSEGGLWLIDPVSGDVNWTYAEPVLLGGISSAPTVDGRQLLVVTNDGYIHSLLVPEKQQAEDLVGLFRRTER
jgi:outer membrane protein assembly factor BamB